MSIKIVHFPLKHSFECTLNKYYDPIYYIILSIDNQLYTKIWIYTAFTKPIYTYFEYEK